MKKLLLALPFVVLATMTFSSNAIAAVHAVPAVRPAHHLVQPKVQITASQRLQILKYYQCLAQKVFYPDLLCHL